MAIETHHQSPLTGSRPHDLLQRSRSQLEELMVLVTSVLYGMWRYRWPSLWLAWGICIVGWFVVYAMPDVYRASTRIYIDAESMIKRVVGDLTVSGDMMTEINILTRAMLSQPQLEKTARLADLDLEVRTPEQHERLIAELARRVNLAKEGGDNMFRISFEDSNRATAELVVQTLLDNFKEDALGERRTDSGAAVQFIDQQIDEYERRLNEAEERLAAFKRDNIGLMPGETGDYYTRLQKSMQTLAETRAELSLANERRAEYERQLEGEEPGFGIVTPSGGQGVQAGVNDALIAQYEADLNTLLIKYTKNHPDAVALTEMIERLKTQQTAVPVRAAPSSAVPRINQGPLEQNPVYQRMRMGLSETDIQITTLRSKLAAEEKAVADLQKLVDTIPEIERQLTAMNRDYEVTRSQYEELLKRRESLRITGEVEQTGDQLQFRTIDPPRASLAPVGPNRPLLLSVTAFLALGVAAALGFVLQQLNPVFTTRRELREITGLPVLGTISLARGPNERAASKRQKLVFGVSAAALPLALGIAVLLQDPGHRFVARLLSVLAA